MNIGLVIITLFAAMLVTPSSLTQAKSYVPGAGERLADQPSNTLVELGQATSLNGPAESHDRELSAGGPDRQLSTQHTVVTRSLQPGSTVNEGKSIEGGRVNRRDKDMSVLNIPKVPGEGSRSRTTPHADADAFQKFSQSNHSQLPGNGAESYSKNGHLLKESKGHDQALDVEEQKLKSATTKLVKWLRNRLRKRLIDVAHLETDMATEKELLKNLSEEIEETSRERENEIKQKLQTKKELSDFRRHLNSPDAGMKRVQSQTKSLSEQLERVKEAYESMAARHKDLESKLLSAGFAHWLEARGRDYFPDTAVGVLSKSAQILGPVSQGFQRALLFDDRLSTEMEQIVPGSDENILGKLVWDITMMVPFIPFVLLLRIANGMVHRLSVYDIVLCGSGLFAAECALCFVMSVFFGREVLGVCQEVNETILIGLLFVNTLVYSFLLFAQVLISCLRPSRAEAVQVILLFTVGCRYYQYVFRPVVLSKPVMVTILSHVLYIITFSLLFVEKKRVMNFKTSYDVYFHKTMATVTVWVSETGQAMRNMFADVKPYGSQSHTESEFESRSSFYASVSNDDEVNSELHEQISTDALEALEYKQAPRTQPITDYLGQSKWNPVNRSASLIRKTFTASQEYGDRMNSNSANSNQLEQARKRSSSNSDDSVAYQSCME